MPVGGRNRKREPSPTDERPTKRQRTSDDLRDNILAAYAATKSPRKSRRSLINANPVADMGKEPAEPQGVANHEQFVRNKEEEISVSRSTGPVTRNRRTYGSKGRARAVQQGTNGASTSPSNVGTSRIPDIEEREEVVELSIFSKGTARQNRRGNPAERIHEEAARDKATVEISHSKEPHKDQYSTTGAKNASGRSLPTIPGWDSDAAAARVTEHSAIFPNNDPYKVDRLSFSPPLLAIDRISHTGAQSDLPDGVGRPSTQSVEGTVSRLPKRRRGRPKKLKSAPEDSPSKDPTLASQPIAPMHQRAGLCSKGKGEWVPPTVHGQLIYPQISTR